MNTPRRTQTRVLKRVGKPSQIVDTPPTSPDISRNSFSSQQLSLSSMGSFGSFRDIPDVDPLLRREKAKQKKEKKKTRKKADKLSQAENDSGNSFSYFGSDSFATSGDMAILVILVMTMWTTSFHSKRFMSWKIRLVRKW
jgi:hypothetical protein